MGFSTGFTLQVINQVAMSQISQRSPDKLKKSGTLSTSNLQKSRIVLPSRYVQPSTADKNDFQEILNTIETKAQQLGSPLGSKNKKTLSKSDSVGLLKSQSKSAFKVRPLKREEHDKIRFHEIFINQRQQALQNLKKSSPVNQNFKTITKEYEKLLKFERGQAFKEQIERIENSNKTTKQTYQEQIELFESGDLFSLNVSKGSNQFYDTQILIEPDCLLPKSTTVSGSKMSNNPSIPPNYKSYKDLNMKQLLLRAKAGTNSEDIEKECHLSFLLGELYTQKKMHKSALKFYRRFLGFAKVMEDRVGICVGANRVGIAYYNCGDFDKSMTFHLENLRLSDQDNCFSGFYNVGICCRKLNKPQEALEYFMSGCSWAQERNQQWSQCISLGEMALTYQEMQLYQESVQKYQQSLEICEAINNKALKLNNLISILRISSLLRITSNEQLLKVALSAFQCAKELGQISVVDVLRCNIGILQGLNSTSTLQSQPYEIQQLIQ